MKLKSRPGVFVFSLVSGVLMAADTAPVPDGNGFETPSAAVTFDAANPGVIPPRPRSSEFSVPGATGFGPATSGLMAETADPSPAPISVALIGSGLIGLGIIRRKPGYGARLKLIK